MPDLTFAAQITWLEELADALTLEPETTEPDILAQAAVEVEMIRAIIESVEEIYEKHTTHERVSCHCERCG